MTNPRPIHFTRPLLGALLLGALLVPGLSLAFPEKGGKGGGAPAAAPVIDAPAADPSEAVSLPATVLRIDGREYSSDLLRKYVRDIMGARPEKRDDFVPFVQKMAVDLAGSVDVIAEAPALDNDVRVLQQVAKVRAKVLQWAYWSDVMLKVDPADNQLLPLIPPSPTEYDLVLLSVDKYGHGEGMAGLEGAERKIREAEALLRGGKSFEELAADPRYNDALSRGGAKVLTLTDVRLSPLSEAEFGYVRDLKPGEVSKPFPTRLGFAMAKMVAVRTPDELLATTLRRDRAQYVAQFRAGEFQRRTDALLDAAKVEWNDGNVDTVEKSITAGKGLPEDMWLLELVKVNGRPVLALALEELPAVHSAETIDIHLDKRVRGEVLAQEVERLGLGAEWKELLDLARRNAVVHQYLERKKGSFPAGDEELKGYYEKNLDRYRYEESRRLRIVETADRKKAESVAKKGRKGEDFEALAAKHNDHPKSRESKGNAGFVPRAGLPAPVAEKVFAAKPGEVVGPLEVPGKQGGKPLYAVIKVEEVAPAGVRPFESLNKQLLRDKYLAGKMGEFNREFLEGIRRRHSLEILMTTDGGRGNEDKQV